jgi:hypothetical protein
MKTAANEYAAGRKCADENTPDEGNTEKHSHGLRASLRPPFGFHTSAFFAREAPAPHLLHVLKFPQAFS